MTIPPTWSWTNDPDTGIYRSGSNQIWISSGKDRPYKLVITFFGENYPKIITWCRNCSKPFNIETKQFSFWGLRGKDKYEQYFEERVPGRIEVYQIQRTGKAKIGKLVKLDDIPGIMGLKYFMNPPEFSIGLSKEDTNQNIFNIAIDLREGLELAEEIEKYRESKV